MSLKAFGVALGVTTFALPGVVQAERINCPHDQIRREVTTSLPAGWWNTPIVNSLTETRVIEVGGRTALQCVYGPAGAIQRYAPDGQTCTASGRGFDCAAARPVTYSTGPLDIPQTWTADLDRGGIGTGGEDIWFQAVTATELYITPRNGATLSVSGTRNRGLDGCATASYSGGSVPVTNALVGTYICVRTNEGRFSEFRVNALSPGSPKTLSIGYTTWQ